MKTIPELESFCEKILTVETNDLYIWLIELYKSQTQSKAIIDVYDFMISKLDCKYTEPEYSPLNIAEQTWGLGAKELFQRDLFDLHAMYYFDCLNKIKLFFLNEIFILSTDHIFQSVAQSILYNIEKAFTLEGDYRKGMKSSFHKESFVYTKWKQDRQKNRSFVDYNIWMLKELVERFSENTLTEH